MAVTFILHGSTYSSLLNRQYWGRKAVSLKKSTMNFSFGEIKKIMQEVSRLYQVTGIQTGKRYKVNLVIPA